jgi:hypothetical protein
MKDNSFEKRVQKVEEEDKQRREAFEKADAEAAEAEAQRRAKYRRGNHPKRDPAKDTLPVRKQALLEKMKVFFKDKFEESTDKKVRVSMEEIKNAFNHGMIGDEERLFHRYAKRLFQQAWPKALYTNAHKLSQGQTFRGRCFRLVALKSAAPRS